MDEMKALQDVFNLRPEMFMAGMRSLDGVRQADAQKLQQQELANQAATLQNQYAQEVNPIKTEQARFGLMKDRAMFPGDLAQSKGQVRKEQESGMLSQEQVPQALTFAASMASNPTMHTPALHGVMRGIMKNAYVPEIMDSWTPQQFAQNLPQMISKYAELLPKQQGAMAQLDAKNAGAMAREEEKTRRGETIARIQAETKRRTQNNAPKEINSLGQYAARLLKQADDLSGIGATEEDLARADVLRGLGNEYNRQIRQDAINKATAGSGGAIDPGALVGPDGKPRFPVKPIVQPTVPQTPTAKPVAPSASGPFTDTEKERRYQEWIKKQQGG